MSGHQHPHAAEDNSHAGQGAVLLDIGGDVGALIVQMPPALVGVEVEACPAGSPRAGDMRPHVAVVARPGLGPTLVFPELTEGTYELYRRPDGPTELTARVVGGAVSEQVWPAGPS
ncbi:MAG: phospholipase [Jatrophihabitantaceae bacterium]